ncbi:NtaA/DmoA family FMN-dependent monooxygenase [Nakamurella leprariae]|uniref:NtaA/DmoA family FMN-dependent monooxygenase n=1 Tax=Nakamurella leprariae TaxID=2803911 RepID=A0A938Y9S1_9ACTN|nr:NtaA/DmoA family FMN-dependent monooxygenase [Nakamurella leprariae]MBM9465673.1 NtaA/DmoA family FMN-dependent monooxygenase [Nakamurella leprariae]
MSVPSEPSHPRQLILGALINGGGSHPAAWRLPDSRVEEAYSLSLFADQARWAEEANLHHLFIADGPTHDEGRFPTRPLRYLEALTVLAVLGGRTTNIGLIPSMSTTFNHPHTLARQLASLDHLTSGRVGWNIVTSFGGAEHFGPAPLLEHDLRYERATEFLEIVRMFWDSWDEDALVIDRSTGVFGDPSKVHADTYDGEYFSVRGPLNLPRSPQGHPVLAQAGASGPGRTVGARFADIIYTATPTVAEGQEFYADVKARAASMGRNPDHVKILPGCSPTLGGTEQEARRRARELLEYLDHERSRAQVEFMLGGTSIAHLDLDEHIPAELLPDVGAVNMVQSRFKIFRQLALVERYTLRQLIEFVVAGGGHWSPVGSVEQVADQIAFRFHHGAADGFNLLPVYQPGGFRQLTTELVPELQRRGLFRTEYVDGTFRDNLGLPRPAQDRSVAARTAGSRA